MRIKKPKFWDNKQKTLFSKNSSASLKTTKKENITQI